MIDHSPRSEQGSGSEAAGPLTDWPLLVTVFGATLLALAIGRWWHTRRAPIFPEDLPNQARKTHEGAVPLVGIVPAIVLVAGLLWLGEPWIAGAALVAATIGFVDDRRKTDEPGDDPAHASNDGFWKTKAIVLLAAAGLVTTGLALEFSLDLWDYPLVFLFVFVLTNAFNFLDNQNGVLLGLVAVAGATDGVMGIPAGWMLSSVALAALPLNWPRGRVFVGDCGAYALGLTAAALALKHYDAASAAPLSHRTSAVGGGTLLTVMSVAIPLLDFVQVVLARLWIGVAPWIGDRRHLTHIALSLGVPAVLVGPIFVVLALLSAFVLELLYVNFLVG